MSRRLVIIGGKTPRELVLVGTMVVGRDPMCDVSEADPLLSKRHAEFVPGVKDVFVRDLGSRNGILINGVKLPQSVLRGGDVVQVGHLQVRYLDDNMPFVAPPEPKLEADVPVAVIPPPPLPAGTPPLPRLDTAAKAQNVADMPTQFLADVAAAQTFLGPMNPADAIDDDHSVDAFDRTVPTIRKPPADDSGTAATVRLPQAVLAAPSANELRDTPTLDVQPFVGPGNRIRFDMPKQDWQLVSGGAVAIVSLVQKSGQAAVVVERATMPQAIAPEDVTDQFARLEAEAVKAQQPAVADVEAKLVAVDTRRLVIVTYSRKGVAGPERVRQYSIPAGSDLYRLTCSAATAHFTRYEPVFAHVAATFAVGAKS